MRLAKLAIGSLLALSSALACAANTFSADVTGLWYDPAENGWGMNLVEQGTVGFATIFVYDLTGKPTWYFASQLTPLDVTPLPPNPGLLLGGNLYAGTGSPFTGTYDPARFAATPVGQMSLAFDTPYTVTLTYTVNGTTLTKHLVPQTWSGNFLGGTYVGAMTGGTDCALPLAQPNGLLNIHITQLGSNANILVTDPTNAQCILTGPVTQHGKLVDIEGNYVCGPGNKTGTFALRRLEAGVDGLMGDATFTPSIGTCAADARARIGAAWSSP